MNVVLSKSVIPICKKCMDQETEWRNTQLYKYLPVWQSDLVKGTLLARDALFLLLRFEKQIL